MGIRSQVVSTPASYRRNTAGKVVQFQRALRLLPAYLLLTVFALLAVTPFIYMTLSSFKPFQEIIDPFPTLFPKQWTIASYVEILTRQGFLRSLWNTVVISTAITLFQGLTASSMGYVFAKYTFPGKELLFRILLSTMMVPFAVVLIPLYIVVAHVGLIDNLGALFVVAMWNTFSIFTMRQFMESIPIELIEAARIDGAGELWIFARIAMPLALAPLTTISVFTFLAQWDNFMFPSVVIIDRTNWTLPLFLSGLKSLYWTRYDIWIAGAMLTILPVLTAYAFTQRTFVRGAQMSGLK
ncbi:MAG: carbohydrate ABC transporter permease [Caldilineaceae bacterium]